MRVSVVRIASAASAPPSAESAAAASRRPASTRPAAAATPITPVERTSTSSASRSSSRPASAAVASASSSPRSPVAAFATPELTTTACGSATSRCAFETTTGAAWTRLTVNIAAPTAGAVERTTARSFAVAPDPRVDAGGDEALRRAVTLIPSTPESRRPGGLGEPEREVRVLHGLAGRALAEVVDRADDDRRAGRAVGEDADLGARRCPARARARARRPRAARSRPARPRRRPRAASRSLVASRLRRSTSRSGRGAPAAGAGRSRRGSRAPARSRARAGARRPCTARRSRAPTPACELAFSARPAPGDARLRVDDDAARLDRTRRAARARAARRSRSSRGSRSARPAGGKSSGRA